MADVYKVAVALSMTSNAPAFLSALSSKLLHVHAQVKDLEGGLNRLNRIKLAVGGGLAVAGGAAVLSTLGKVIDKGNEIVKVRQNMAAAGVKAIEVEEAYAKAVSLSAKYKNVGIAEAMKVISEGRMTFGSQHEATHHSEDFVRMISFLKAYQGGKHGHGASNFEAEAIAAMKSGEIAGKVTPVEMAEHVKQLTAMRVAYGDQLKIGQYLTAQRAAGVALRNTSDDFRYGMFPALVQENGPNAGTMLMTAFNKIVAGTGNRTRSLEHMADIGLLKRDQLLYDKNGRIKGLKDPSAIKDNREAAMNFGDWVMKTLKPRLDKQTTDPIRQAQLISAMFPDRNAAKAITEILQQFTKLTKDAALMREARSSLNENAYLDKSWEGQKEAFWTQLDNFGQALGAPLVGPATENLAKLTVSITKFSQWAAQPDLAPTIESVGKGIAILGASLTAGGAAALLAAIGPAGWLAAGLTALIAIDFKGAQQQWEMAKRDFALLSDFVKWAGGKVDEIHKSLEPYLSLLGMGQKVDHPGMSESAREALRNRQGDGDSMGRLVTTVLGGIRSFVESIAPYAKQWEEMKAQAFTAVSAFLPKMIEEIKSWPSRLGTAITEFGAGLVTAIGDMLKNLFKSLNPFSRTGFDGEGGIGSMIQKASFSPGGGANDNAAGGASGVARALGRGGTGRTVPRGAFGPGTGAGNSWYEAIMRAEGTAGKDPYNVVLGNGRYGLPSKPLTDMTLAEAYAFGRTVRARHGASSAIGAFQIVGQTMKTFMGEAGLTWSDKFSPENQRKLAAVIAKRQGFRAWEGFKVHPGELGNARQMKPIAETPVPTAPPPPPKRESRPIMVDLHMDGKKMGRAIAAHQADDHLFPKSAGGMDTHGSWRAPGTPVADAA